MAFWISNIFNLTFPLSFIAHNHLMVEFQTAEMSVGVIFSFWLIYVIVRHTGKGNWKNQQTYGNVLFKNSILLKFLFSVLLCYFLMNSLTISQFNFVPTTIQIHRKNKGNGIRKNLLFFEKWKWFYQNTSEFSLLFFSF